MRRLRWAVLIALVPLFAVACGDGDPAAPQLSPDGAVAAAAEVSWVPGTAYFDDTWWLPCVGEALHFTGTFWYRTHSVVNGNREIVSTQSGMSEDFQAVGAASGVWRVDPSTLNGIIQQMVVIAPVGGAEQVISTTNPRFTFVNEETGAILYNPLRAQLVRNAAGEIKVYMYTEPCRLK
jgi:hypothetical protein